MAACSISHPHRDLYNDMRVQFPELPDTVIRSYVQLYPRNREQCIQQLTLASQNQLYSQYDSEENPPSRGCGGDGFGGGSCAARVFEPLDPPFATRLSPREETGPHGAPGSSRAPPAITAPWLREYRSPTNFNPSVGPWFPPVELDPPGNRLPPALDDMTQALLTHQRQRYELLQRTYAQQLEVLQQLRREVEAKETQLITKTLLDVTPTHVDELQRLRRENRTLDVECHCLLSEVDLYSRGEVPLGATDEHFYRRLNPGQTVPVAPPSAASTVTPAPPAASLHSLLSEDEENQDDNRWKCSKCTFLNHPALDKCEVCEMPNVARDV
ncbi:TGF-beta-activated kinase 1 and MAP3K7-binding protein 2 [Ixodes scapularis]